ncbi:MAG: hypothetical protein A2736_03230 [Candidatus Yanofskybacteria bacterium RIFCSPHIGHO2_01_FULL_41_27]|uniref:Single-stranded DNA-binding protein n=4 Tax=Parcubacteria group TaxID=1794811 RepID=A0A1F8HRP4_9BACT|nr:MAG: single-strand binding protein [Candidatus Jorgensenbacteria bacterium GW2011_GWF2_41_8]KKS27804.1 MAG: single-strand binding protein [Candidatus Yanofskybacteria bacterium GW2011_GWC2_41_9]OGM99823.1 MAG: hypothetical protein A2736_03230 [Candidatus Yanofskybacteria bacterium RIFCSPHIGHO2_01_FULL_41_27]OGN21187.1 MAG: hypothetical protein A3B00_01475 [Candidatus Yanofskybacteria bacterium RIFCSPLOWO2_01_FULL_41_33]OGN40254.1 MAG: hypothetical protein A2606_00820 [Candidatus Yanofskybact
MNLNKVFLIGRLTQDPEARSTPTGQNVTTLRMATNRVWTDASGQRKDATEYHTVVAWRRLGEIAAQYLKKGGLVMIEGRLQTRSWTDQSNNKRYMTEILAESLQLGPKPYGSEAGNMVRDIQKNPAPAPIKNPETDNIPIIDENEPMHQGVAEGVEEDEVKIKEEDLPF